MSKTTSFNLLPQTIIRHGAHVSLNWCHAGSASDSNINIRERELYAPQEALLVQKG
jgi:hypothetical protein